MFDAEDYMTVVIKYLLAQNNLLQNAASLFVAIHRIRSRGCFQKEILTLPLPGIHLTILEGQNVTDTGN